MNSSRSISPGCVVTRCTFQPSAGLSILIEPSFLFSSVVIDNLYVFRAVLFPEEADSEFFVDSNAELASPVALQGFQSISGRHPEVPQFRGEVNPVQLAFCSSFD
jgi:hypothetical protein